MNNDLISREAVKDEFLTRCSFLPEIDKRIGLIILNDIPSADAVPVIRCLNCKYYNLQALACTHDNFNGTIGMDGFCSYGERKE